MAPRKTRSKQTDVSEGGSRRSEQTVSEGGSRRSSRLAGLSPSKSEISVSDAHKTKRGRKPTAPKPNATVGKTNVANTGKKGGDEEKLDEVVANITKDAENPVGHPKTTNEVSKVANEVVGVNQGDEVANEGGGVNQGGEANEVGGVNQCAAANEQTIDNLVEENIERDKSRKHPLHSVRNGSKKRVANHGSGMFRYL